MSEKRSRPRPVQLLIRGYLLFLGVVVTLAWAVDYLGPLLPWIGGIVVLVMVVWITVAIIRWRRSRW